MATAVYVAEADWAALRAMFGDRFSDSAAIRDHHGRAETFYPAMPPDAVVFPLSTEEVAAAVIFCKERGIAVTPYGTGTSLEGNFLAARGGLCIDLSRMDQVLRVSPEDLDCTVQAGVTAVPVSAFYQAGDVDHYVRFCFARPEALIDEAIRRLRQHFGRA